jgi:hypothetical protein
MLVAALVLAALQSAGCGGGTDKGSAEDGPTVSELVAEPEGYYGQETTIEAVVSRQMDHRVWEMAGGRLFAIYDRGFSQDAPSPGDRLRLTGTPEPLDQARIEGELGVNIEDHFFAEPFLQDDVAFVAEDVERLD